MALKVEDGTGKKVEGKGVGEYLVDALRAHVAHSETASKLLSPILDGNGYTVVIKSGGKTATNAKRVTINSDEVGIKSASKLEHLKEFVESTIFELTNAKNSEVFKKLEDDLVKGDLPIMTYGKQKSDAEAEASWNVAKIITEHSDYVPSKWGKGHVDQVKNKSLKDYKPIFASFPHATEGSEEAKLLTPLFYAYNAAVTLGGKAKALDACFKKLTRKIKNKEQQVYVQNLVRLSSQGAKQNKFDNPKWCALYYQVVMRLVLKDEGFIAKELKTGTAEDWKFTKEMKKVAPDTDDAMMKIFEEILKNDRQLDEMMLK